MRRPAGTFLALFAILIAGASGLAVGRSNAPLPGWVSAMLPAAAKPVSERPAPTGPIIYYRDPDNNQIELQIDNFDTEEALEEFFASGAFAANPIGVEFDPDDLHRRLLAGEPISELVKQSGNPVALEEVL